MSIATKRGDGGETGLAGGIRVSKADLRVESYGSVDELNTMLGFARSICEDKQIAAWTEAIQRTLFRVGSALATPPESRKQPPVVSAEDVDMLTDLVHTIEAREGILADWSLPGAHTESAALNADSSFLYDPAALLVGEQQAVLLANPQNPSGATHDRVTVRKLIAMAAGRNTYVLLDEAFIDYVPEDSLTAAVDEFPNLVVFRSVTKFHAIPGLRVAYALANPSLARMVGEALPPWPVTTLASRGVIAALGDEAYADRTRAENLTRRTELKQQLDSLGLTVYPSSANFLLFHIPRVFDPDDFWRRMIVDHRIVLRYCANYEALAQGHFRAAVRTHAENRSLVRAIEKVITS